MIGLPFGAVESEGQDLCATFIYKYNKPHSLIYT